MPAPITPVLKPNISRALPRIIVFSLSAGRILFVYYFQYRLYYRYYSTNFFAINQARVYSLGSGVKYS
jgi:hypothetical protein